MRYPTGVFVGITLLIFCALTDAVANENVSPSETANALSEQEQFTSTVKQLSQLINAKQYQKAFAYSNSNTEFLGEPKFDFLAGLAALKSKHAHEAVFAFERVINLEPKWHEARFHLASSYLLANNIPAAQAELDQLNKAGALPNAVESNIPILRRAINRRLAKTSQSYDHMLAIGGGFDSNVNAGSAEDSIFIPALGSDIPLSENSQETNSSYLTGTYLGRYSQMITQKQKLDVSGMFNVNQFNDAADYNRMSGAISGRYTFIEKSFSYAAGANIAPLWLDGELYRTYIGADVGAQYSVNETLLLNTSLKIGTTINQLDDRLDLNSYGYSVGAMLNKNNILHSVTVTWLNETASESTAEYNGKDSLALQYAASLPLADKLTYRGLIAFSNYTHHAAHPVFGEERDESLIYLNNTLTYELWPKTNASAGLGFQDKSSNVSLYEYNRFDMNLSFNMSF
jgi:hypothetical protein